MTASEGPTINSAATRPAAQDLRLFDADGRAGLRTAMAEIFRASCHAPGPMGDCRIEDMAAPLAAPDPHPHPHCVRADDDNVDGEQGLAREHGHARGLQAWLHRRGIAGSADDRV